MLTNLELAFYALQFRQDHPLCRLQLFAPTALWLSQPITFDPRNLDGQPLTVDECLDLAFTAYLDFVEHILAKPPYDQP